MKAIWWFVLGSSLLCAGHAWAMDIQNAHSGSWWNSDQSGHGFSVEVLDDETLVAYWFVYSPTGEPIFLLTVADIDGATASGPVYQYSGMRFGEFDPETLNEAVWGSMSIEFTGCGAARVSYQSDAMHEGHAYGSGTIDLTRLTAIRGLRCKEPLAWHGNFVADVMEKGVDVGDASIMILKDGTLAYLAEVPDVQREVGVGQLVMTDDDSFDFEVDVDYFGPYWGPTPGPSVFHGSGNFSDGVSLDAPGAYSLQGVMDAAVHEGITQEQLTDTWTGTYPYMAIPTSFWIAADGSVKGYGPGGCEMTGDVTIPDPEFNQFRMETEGCNFGKWTSVGTLIGEQLYMITRLEYGEVYGVWDWYLD